MARSSVFHGGVWIPITDEDHRDAAAAAHAATAISIADAGSHFTGTTVEAALQELGAGGTGSDLGIINVVDYGATGDGTTDDTSAIQAAIAAMTPGCTLYFPATSGAYYKVTATLSITQRGCRIEGAGSQYGTRIHMATSNTTLFSVVPTALDGTRLQTNLISHLLLTGPGGAVSGRGVYASSDVHLNDVGIVGFYEGLRWDNVTFYSRMYGGFITNCVRGIFMSQTNNCTVDTVRITGDFGGGGLIGPVEEGIWLDTPLIRGLTNRIINCSIEYFEGTGVRWDGGSGGELLGNYFESQQSSSGNAHVILGANYPTEAIFIAGNYFQGDGLAGFPAIKAVNTEAIVLGPNKYGINNPIGIDASGAGNSRWFIMPQMYDSGTFDYPASSYEIDPDNPPMTAGDAAGGDLSGTYPSPSVVDDSHNHTAATLPAGSSGGELLISSTHSTPLVFGDILQTSAGDDFVYSS